MSNGPRIFTKTINGLTVRAYNDSGCDWVVDSPELDAAEIRFQIRLPGHRLLTMKRAMEMFADIYSDPKSEAA